MEATILDFQMPKGTRVPLKVYIRTIPGIAMIQSGELFCLDGQLYQGFNGTGVAIAYEDVLSDEEMGKIHDVDDTLHIIQSQRSSRTGGREVAREKERRERKLVKDQASLVGIQLAREELALEEQRLKTENARLENERLKKSADPLSLDEEVFACDKCDARFSDAQKLRGHKAGKHS
jgi:hypothetical protein